MKRGIVQSLIVARAMTALGRAIDLLNMKALLFSLVLPLLLFAASCGSGPPIRVGVLYSLAGSTGANEEPVSEATLLAIQQINNDGGILGRRIEPLVVDGKSDPVIFAREAERLITQEGVSAIFGCWTSTCRKAVRVVVEEYDNLLFYPLQYEGLEESPNIVYTGAAPNQQIIPAVKWSFDNLGRRFFLLGSDYVFPRAANEIVKDQIAALGGEVVGEEYVLLGRRSFGQVVKRILQAHPDVILNTINGDSNVGFFTALREAGITPATVPTMSFSLGEIDLSNPNLPAMAGDYAAWNYFETIESPENTEFVESFQAEYGADRVISDPMEAAYIAVHLWAQAVTDAESPDPVSVRQMIGDQSMVAPEGLVYVDAATQHTWKTVRIGEVNGQGEFDIVWSSDVPIRPVTFPTYRFRSDWERFLETLYQGWGGRWVNPGSP